MTLQSSFEEDQSMSAADNGFLLIQKIPIIGGTERVSEQKHDHKTLIATNRYWLTTVYCPQLLDKRKCDFHHHYRLFVAEVVRECLRVCGYLSVRSSCSSLLHICCPPSLHICNPDLSHQTKPVRTSDTWQVHLDSKSVYTGMNSLSPSSLGFGSWWWRQSRHWLNTSTAIWGSCPSPSSIAFLINDIRSGNGRYVALAACFNRVLNRRNCWCSLAKASRISSNAVPTISAPNHPCLSSNCLSNTVNTCSALLAA